MVEGVLALLVVGLVLGLGVLTPLPLLAIGAGLTAAGLSASAAVGWLYHRRLRAELLRRRPMPAGWWWAPSRLHRELDEAGRDVVLPYFRVGLLLILVALGAVKAWLAVDAG